MSGSLTLGGELPRTVLGLLALDLSRDLDQDIIQEQIWPDQPPRRKSAQVFSLISNLRGALGDDVFPRTRGRYRLSIDPVQVDVHRFELGVDEGFGLVESDPIAAEQTLRTALDSWRGDPFADMVPDVERLIGARRSLEVKYLSAQRALIDVSMALGRQRELVPALVDLTERFPSEASFWVHRMTAHARLGEWNTAEALVADAAVAHGRLDVPVAESIKACARRVEDRDPSLLGPTGAGHTPAVRARTADGEDGTSASVTVAGAKERVIPYKGLAAFQPEDRAAFFGREAITSRLLSRLRSDGFVTVAGPSGSGKSSIVRAGIVGSLRGTPGVSVHLMTPGDDPIRSLAAWWSTTRRADVAAAVRSDATAIEDLLDELLDRSDDPGGAKRVVLVVDQFEELFTQCGAADRTVFIRALAAMQRVEQAAVVIALRADFAGRCAEDDILRRLVNRTWQLVGPMSADELRRAIEDPADQAGISIEPGLVDRVIADADPDHESGSLPLVSHALFETCSEGPPAILSHVAYHRAGGVKAAIARTADRVFEQHFDDDQRALADELLLRMVAVQPDGPDVRRLVPTAVVESTPGLTELVHELADARLVTLDGDGVQMAHEALMTRWPRLVNLLRERSDDLRFEARLETDVATWTAAPSVEQLYRGRQLEWLVDWSERSRFAPAPDTERFLAASTRQAGRSRWMRRASVASALVAAAAVVFVVGFAASRINAGAAEDAARQASAGTFVEIGGRTPTLAIRTTEITNADYRRCVEFNACPAPRDRLLEVDGELMRPFADGPQDHPVRNISADEASRFCQWIGAELPHEPDLRRAISGDGDRAFPWGDEPPGDGELADASVDLGGATPEPWAVDDDPRRSVDGVNHLLGNVAEWTATPDVASCIGPCDPLIGWTRDDRNVLGLRVLGPNIFARTRSNPDSWFGARDATSVAEDLGARCVRT